jgi:site-specific recombinase XerD
MSSNTQTQLAVDTDQLGSAEVALPAKKTPNYLKYRPDGICACLPCSKPVPGGMVHFNVGKYFCSEYCQRKEYNQRTVIGTCEQCGGPVCLNNDRSRTAKIRFCSTKCLNDSRREKSMSGTGCFRDLITEYISGNTQYAEGTIVMVRSRLASFFTYVYSTEKITSVENITPRVVTRFIAAERARGMTNGNPVAHVSSFFRWMESEERLKRSNPVIARIHGSTNRNTRQPYDEIQMSTLWQTVEVSGNTQLKLMFAIGEESGLRSGEVCNIRLADINLDRQSLYVRLPTKNKTPRTVSFHNKVKKYLMQWLSERDPRCVHDHLFHTDALTPVANSLSSRWFKRLYGKLPEPAASFEFHRLRHSWATNLINAGMELPVLQQLGGWKSLSSVQIYAKIRKSTVERQYRSAYDAIEQKLNSPQEETLSLTDFAFMDLKSNATTADSAS